MHCKQCGYGLFDITGRICPECGLAFKPTDFSFVINSCKFLCPHCRQDYYGTGEGGHLEPNEFNCARCGQHICEDEMIVFPASGVKPEHTEGALFPWTRPEKGVLWRLAKTIMMAMFTPNVLARAMPKETDVPKARAFAAWAFGLSAGIMGCAVLAFCGFIGFVSSQGSSRAFAPGSNSMGVAAAFAAGGPLAMIAFVLVWCLLTHGVLRLRSSLAGGIGRTFECFCYGSAVLSLSPILLCLWPLYFLGVLWAAISIIVMLHIRHGVSVARAMLAVSAPPVLGILLFVLWIVAMAYW